MKIEFEAIIRTSLTGERRTQYKQVRVADCCKPMGEAWLEEHFGLQENKPVVCVDFESSGYYGEVDHGHQKIGFCPFCGHPVELYQVKQTELVEKIVKRTETRTYDQSVWEPSP